MQTASTPTQPSPLEGEGSDRWSAGKKVRPATASWARHHRQAPTWTEARLWERLRLLSIRFRRQAPIGPYVADFACLRARLVVEVDGGVHDLADVALRDVERDAWLTSQGYAVLRIDARRIPSDIDAVVAEIEHSVARALPAYRPQSA